VSQHSALLGQQHQIVPSNFICIEGVFCSSQKGAFCTTTVVHMFCDTCRGDFLTANVAQLLCLLQVTELQEQLQARDRQMQGVMQQHTAHSSGLSQERQQLFDQARVPLSA